MVCTQCGTQIAQGKNFCKNCGASLAKTAAPVAGEQGREAVSESARTSTERITAAGDRTQALPIAPARERRGINKAVAAALGVVILIAAGAAVYFGTGLFQGQRAPESSTAAQETTAPIVEPPFTLPVEPPEETARSGQMTKDSDFTSPLRRKEAGAPPSTAMEAPTAPSESKPTTAPKQSPATTARKAQSQPPVSDARARERTPAPPAPAKPVRPAASPGTYQTVRQTRVHESPSATSKVVARIDDGMRVNVVGSTGEWLEIRSKTGNPPGFIRRDDAVPFE